MLLQRQFGLLGPLAVKQQADADVQRMLQVQGRPSVMGAPGGVQILPSPAADFERGAGALSRAIGDFAEGKKEAAELERAKDAVSSFLSPTLTPEQTQTAGYGPGPSRALAEAQHASIPAVQMGMSQPQIDRLNTMDPFQANQIINSMAFRPDKPDQLSPLAVAKRDLDAGRISRPTYEAMVAKATHIPAGAQPRRSPIAQLNWELESGAITEEQYDSRVAKLNEPRGPLVQIGGNGQSNPQVTATNETTAAKTGVPQTNVSDPFARFSDPKKADEARKTALTKYHERKGKVEAELRQAEGMVQSLTRFNSLLDIQETGGIARNFPMFGAGGMLDAEKMWDDEAAEMQSIIDKMTPQMRQGMPGAASDRDVSMFKGATVSRKISEGANRNIAAGLMAANQNRLEKETFIDDFFESYGHTIGADRFWKEYLEANPIFDPDAEKGSYKLNESRQSRQDFFANGVPDQKTVSRTKKNKTAAAFFSANNMEDRAKIFIRLSQGSAARKAIIAGMDEAEKAEFAAWLEENGYGN